MSSKEISPLCGHISMSLAGLAWHQLLSEFELAASFEVIGNASGAKAVAAAQQRVWHGSNIPDKVLYQVPIMSLFYEPSRQPLPTAELEDHRSVFLSLVDRFTPAHLRILKEIVKSPNSKTQQLEQNRSGTSLHESHGPVKWVKQFVPSLKAEDENFVRVLIDDLQSAGLTPMK